ncbi:MAG: acylphosphatase [Thermodesulfobacteriota bacterium]|nr:acylphosphatase [Thermodesulfobacteriota bacterium]
MAEKRCHARITGRVQGVCFRMETKKAADDHDVKGWVRNRMDGSVEAVFEGEKEDVDAVVKWCQQGPPAAAVTGVDTSEESYTGEFSRFEVTV